MARSSMEVTNMNDLASWEQPGSDSASGSASSARHPVERAREGAHQLVDRVADRAIDRAGAIEAVQERWLTDLRDKVDRQPITTVAVAAAVGVLLGRLFDRG